MKLIGELIEVISGRAGLNNLREVGESLKSGKRPSDEVPTGTPHGRLVDQLLDVVGSDLLDFGQMIIAGMKKTTGEGSPDTGELFGHGHSGFNTLGVTLQSVGPNDSWDGSGSRAYADQNTRQQLRAESMADADREVHRVLFREAAQITLRRGFLDDQSNFLANTSYATFPLQFIPRYGEAAKLAIEISALQGALGLSAEQMYHLHSEAAANAAELQQAIGRYSGVADGAELPGAGVDFAPPAAPALGGSPTGTIPIERSERVVAGAGGGQPAPAGGPSGSAPDPTQHATLLGGPLATVPDAPVALPAGQPPSAPAAAPIAPPSGGGAGALGALAGALGGLLVGATQAAVQRAAAHGPAGEPESGHEAERKDTKEKDEPEDVKDSTETAPGQDASERAPVDAGIDADPDHPQSPVTVRLDPDTSPGPRAGMPPQDKK